MPCPTRAFRFVSLIPVLATLLVAAYWTSPAVPRAPEGKKTEVPSDLALVPRHAAGFIHIRAADIWKSDLAEDIRYFLDKAGGKALESYQKRVPFDLSTVESLTLIFPSAQSWGNPFLWGDPEGVSALLAVRTNKPLDRRKMKLALADREKTYRHKLYYFLEEMWCGLVLVDDRTFLIGSEDSLIHWFDLIDAKKGDGNLDAALAEAGASKAVVVGINPRALAQANLGGRMPAEFQPILQAECVRLSFDLGKEMRVDAQIDFAKEEEAKKGEKAITTALEMAREGMKRPIKELEDHLEQDKSLPPRISTMIEGAAMVAALGILREVERLLQEATPKFDKNSVLLGTKVVRPKDWQSPSLMAFAIAASGRGAFATFSDIDGKKEDLEGRIRALASALDKYQEDKGCYPPAAIHDKDGRPMLSWRVALLPYLGQEDLYKEFRLDEPWDSLHNKKLLKKIPSAFTSRMRESGRYGIFGYERVSRGRTGDLLIVGPGTIFDGKKGIKKDEVDKETILVIHTRSAPSIYWTKPADIEYAADKPLSELLTKGDLHAILVDGTYKAFKNEEEKTLRKLIERTKKK